MSVLSDDRPDREQITAILAQLDCGQRDAADRLMPLVYDELRSLADRYMKHERRNHTLQATAIVNEAYLRLVDQTRVDWKNRAQFFAVAAEMIRRVLVDHARGAAAEKRGGGRSRISLDGADARSAPGPQTDPDGIDLLALDEALDELGRLSDRQRRVVELRFFGGLEVQDVAHVLDISPTTVKEDWRVAKAWLRKRLRND